MSSSKNKREAIEELRKAIRERLDCVTDLETPVKAAILEVLDLMGKRPLQGLMALLKNHPKWTAGKEIKVSYDHSPRVLADLKDYGIPILGGSKTPEGGGKKSYHYRLGDSQEALSPLKGRQALRKTVKRELLQRFGNVDALSKIAFAEASLQIDHRIPFRIAGDSVATLAADRFMLLSAPSQRTKGMACKRCPNMKTAIPDNCRRCYWASPDNYDHVAMTKAKVTTIVWEEEDNELLLALTDRSAENVENLSDQIKSALRLAVTRAE